MNSYYTYHIVCAYENPKDGSAYLRDAILYTKTLANTRDWVQDIKDALKQRHSDSVAITVITWKRLEC